MADLIISCPEPEGLVLRRVRPMQRTPEDLAMVLDKINGIPNLFSGMTCWRSMDELYDEKKVFLLVDDVGIICFAPSTADGMRSAHVHITFWDKRLRGRELLCKAVAAQAVDDLGLHYLWTAIPETSRTVLAFAKRIGFREARRFGPTVVLELTRGHIHGY